MVAVMATQLGDVTIRPARVEDASQIARVHISSWQEAYAGIVPDDVLANLDVARRESEWHENLESGPRRGIHTWLAEADVGPVGFASLGPSRDEDADSRVFEIYAIYLAPDAWGRGVARDLMRTMLAEPAAADPITLWVLADNDRARHFYRRHGFQHDGTERLESFGGARLLEVRYRRG